MDSKIEEITHKNLPDCVFISKIDTYDINYFRLIDVLLTQIFWPWSHIIKYDNFPGSILQLFDSKVYVKLFEQQNYIGIIALIIVNFLTPLLFQYTVIASFILNEFHKSVLPITLFLLQKIMVSFKYAFLTDEEYQRLISIPAEELDKIFNYQRQLQLISGWLEGNSVLLEWEVDRVSEMAGGDGNSVEIILNNNEYKRWKLFLNGLGINSDECMRMIKSYTGKQNSENDNGDRISSTVNHINDESQAVAAINIKVLCKAIYKVVDNIPAMKLSGGAFHWFIFVLQAIIIFLIWLDYAYYHHNTSYFFILFMIAKTILILVFFTPVMLFARTAQIDISRRMYISIMLNDLIRVDNDSADRDIEQMNKINLKAHKAKVKVNAKDTNTNTNDKNGQDLKYKKTLFESSRLFKRKKSVNQPKPYSTSTVPIPVLPVSITDNDSSNNALQLPSSWQHESLEEKTRKRQTLPRSMSVSLKESYDKTTLYAEEKAITDAVILRYEEEKKKKKLNQNIEYDYMDMPPITLDRINNISGWHYLRTVCMRMGGRHLMRINILLGMNMFLTLIIFGFTALYIFGMSSVQIYDFLEFALFATAMILVFVSTIVTGALTNYEYKMHRQTLIFNALRNESKSIWIYRQIIELQKDINHLKKIVAVEETTFSQYGDSDEENDSKQNRKKLGILQDAVDCSNQIILRLNDAIESINHVNDTLEVSNTIYPIKICGIRCDFKLVSTLMTGVVTVVSTLSTQN